MGAACVLICDDEPSLRELMRVSLGPDYAFEEAADGPRRSSCSTGSSPTWCSST